ncbi:MAG: hypothetical protein OSJ69_13985 [Acetatifactor sp.]|nr:hypothetical protein [Acetatifactor sp.]
MDWEEKNGKETDNTQEDVREAESTGEDNVEPEEEIETAAQREAREKREEEERKEKARKRKLIPPFVTLLAGAIVSITMRILHYETLKMLIILLCVLLCFYFVGRVLQIMLDRFELQIQEAHMEEGEVIEKEPSE